MTHHERHLMSTPILCFVGRSNSGKTTLIERLIPQLVQAGYRVATIKHAGHGFDLDTEGKDSWRHKRAGADTVMVISKGSLAMFSDVSDEIKIEELRDRFLIIRLISSLPKGGRAKAFPRSLSYGTNWAKSRCLRRVCWRWCPTSRWICRCPVWMPTTLQV